MQNRMKGVSVSAHGQVTSPASVPPSASALPVVHAFDDLVLEGVDWCS